MTQSEDPIQRCYALIRELIETLRSIQVPVPRGQQANQPKLSQREVNDILDLHRKGLNYREIAEIYDVHPTTISRRVSKHKKGI